MRVEVREVTPVIREVTVELPAEMVSAELDRYYRDLRGRVKIPGFRPGHVPRNILERRFGSDVNLDVAGRLVSATFRDGLRNAAVEPVADPVVQKEPVTPGATFRYSMRCEVKPPLDPADYFDLEASAPEVSISETAVEEELTRIRSDRAELRPAEGRTLVEQGDFVTIDVDALVEGKPFEGGTSRERVFEVGSQSAIPGFDDKLLGAEVGKVCEFDLPLPADLNNKKVAGKTARFQVKVSDIKVRVVPALDDDFAKEVAQVDTVADLRVRVRQSLERRARAESDRAVNDQLVDAALAKNPFEVPPSLVEAELDSGMREAQMSLSMMGIDPAQVPFDARKMRQDLRPRAEKRARRRILLEAIGSKEKVSVDESEIDQRIRGHAEATGQALSKVRQTFAKPERRERLRAQIVEEKVLDLLRSRARMKTVVVPTEETTGKTGSGGG
jgi:trigger factor